MQQTIDHEKVQTLDEIEASFKSLPELTDAPPETTVDPLQRQLQRYIDIVFDGPPEHEAGRFVEVEDEQGKSVSVGQWINRGDGYWALRIHQPESE